MTASQDLVREACQRLAGHMNVLERLLAEPASPSGGPAGLAPRPAVSPEPWNTPAGHALMDSHEGIRRLEAVIRYTLNGHPGPRRGGSLGNTAAALDVIPRLAAALTQGGETLVARILERWIREAQTVPDIGEAERYRPLPRHGAGLPACCPCCGSYLLKAVVGLDGELTGRIECHVPDCFDSHGYHPVAQMGTDQAGWPCLFWADGTVTPAPPNAAA